MRLEMTGYVIGSVFLSCRSLVTPTYYQNAKSCDEGSSSSDDMDTSEGRFSIFPEDLVR